MMNLSHDEKRSLRQWDKVMVSAHYSGDLVDATVLSPARRIGTVLVKTASGKVERHWRIYRANETEVE